MKIEHLAIWSDDIETLRRFYERYFNATSNEKYTNPAKGFSSYFLSFESETRLEVMQSDAMPGAVSEPDGHRLGFAHLAFSVGSRERVDQLTTELKQDGYRLLDGPRTTGDGYYESTILDPEGNRLEITI